MTYKLNREQRNKITITNIILVFCLLFLPLLASSQTKKLDGTYIHYYGEEYLQIKEDSFKIIRAPETINSVDLDKGDSVIAYGNINDKNDGYIKLSSYPYYLDVYKNTTFEESHDDKIKDSLYIKFNFPYNWRYKIITYYYMEDEYYTTYSNKIIIPLKEYGLDDIVFIIYNLDIAENDYPGNYLGLISFIYFPAYDFKHKNTNSLTVSIPNLTNSYYARYFIDGEYAKVEDNKIIWRNRQYEKVSDSLIDVHYNKPENFDESEQKPIPDVEIIK